MAARLIDKRQCTGCGACMYTCPQGAVTMVESEGFVFPKVNSSICVDCGACGKVCHASVKSSGQRLAQYYGWHNNEEIRADSSSGGAFTALAQTILYTSGLVYAHAFDPVSQYVRCMRADSLEHIKIMRQSKYVESELYSAFEQIENDLDAERTVMFTGTPCQCAAVQKLFGDNHRLFTVSLLCHGVSSPKHFGEHLRNISGKHIVSNVRMREKKLGWHDYVMGLHYSDTERVDFRHYTTDAYYYCDMVLSLCLRDSCYACTYSNTHMSDITIGDFWKIRSVNAAADDNKGISLMIANTEKGANLLNDAVKYMSIFSLKPDDISYAFYPAGSHNSPEVLDMLERKIAFLSRADKLGFEKAAGIYMTGMPVRYAKVFIKRVVNRLGLR